MLDSARCFMNEWHWNGNLVNYSLISCFPRADFCKLQAKPRNAKLRERTIVIAELRIARSPFVRRRHLCICCFCVSVLRTKRLNPPKNPCNFRTCHWTHLSFFSTRLTGWEGNAAQSYSRLLLLWSSCCTSWITNLSRLGMKIQAWRVKIMQKLSAAFICERKQNVIVFLLLEGDVHQVFVFGYINDDASFPNCYARAKTCAMSSWVHCN